MKKKLIQRDLSKIVKSKFVRLILGTDNIVTNTNRWFFSNDGQLDDKIIVGIDCHSGMVLPPPNPGDDFPAQIFYNVVSGYADFYYAPTLIQSGPKFTMSNAYISLLNKQGRFFWYQQPLSSLNKANVGRYPKKLFSRITLDKCYIESPVSLSFGVNNVPVSYYIPFTFYYIDDPNF